MNLDPNIFQIALEPYFTKKAEERMIKDPLFNLPTCDICQELNKEDHLMPVFDIDSHEDLMVCDTCLKMNADQLREPGDEIDRIYDAMRDEEMGL